jgi:hypothetical protein
MSSNFDKNFKDKTVLEAWVKCDNEDNTEATQSFGMPKIFKVGTIIDSPNEI